MEFVNGGDLCSLLKNLGYLSEDVAVKSARAPATHATP